MNCLWFPDETDPGPQYQNVTHVSRLATAGFFSVANHSNDTDMIPPSKITDLRVLSSDPDNRIVNLEWTAPGDDLDIGTGKKSLNN